MQARPGDSTCILLLSPSLQSEGFEVQNQATSGWRVAQATAEEARQYLMSLHGLGRKSVACITLLGLQLKVRAHSAPSQRPPDLQLGTTCTHQSALRL